MLAHEKPSVHTEDQRQFGFFIVDNELITRYGKMIGPLGIAVYSALAMHAGRRGSCFPSQGTIAEELGIGSRHTVIKAISSLESAGLISVRNEGRRRNGQYRRTIYTLLPIPKERCAENAQGKAEPCAIGAQPCAIFDGSPCAQSAQEQDVLLINKTNEEQDTTEPARQNDAGEGAEVGSSLREGEKDPALERDDAGAKNGFSSREVEKDPAIEPEPQQPEKQQPEPQLQQPDAGALIDALNQVATIRGIEPGKPSADLLNRLQSLSETAQIDLIAYVGNYSQKIKTSFWGLVKSCVENPDWIAGSGSSSPSGAGAADSWVINREPINRDPIDDDTRGNEDQPDLPTVFTSLQDALVKKFNSNGGWRRAIEWPESRLGKPVLIEKKHIRLVEYVDGDLVIFVDAPGDPFRFNPESESKGIWPSGYGKVISDHAITYPGFKSVRWQSRSNPIVRKTPAESPQGKWYAGGFLPHQQPLQQVAAGAGG